MDAIPPTAPPPRPAPTDDALRKAAQELEATFLAEMLVSAGLGKPPEAFGGAAGESQFQTFLVREQARQLAAKGGIGLAESIFETLKGRIHD